MALGALVRGVPESFARALTATVPDPPLDVARARAQHDGYVAALAAVGVTIVRVPADEACPDCCFIEDTAIVVGDVAIVTRPGAPERRAEVDAVARAFAGELEVVRLEAPGTVDGGDCLLQGRTLYVGASRRTNPTGIAWLAAELGRRGVTVVPVAVPPRILHLKSVCSALGPDRVLVAEGSLPADTFPRALVVPADEAHGANVVCAGGHVLVAAGCPRTRDLTLAAGFAPHEVDTPELRRADGALTCLSIVYASSGRTT